MSIYRHQASVLKYAYIISIKVLLIQKLLFKKKKSTTITIVIIITYTVENLIYKSTQNLSYTILTQKFTVKFIIK